MLFFYLIIMASALTLLVPPDEVSSCGNHKHDLLILLERICPPFTDVTLGGTNVRFEGTILLDEPVYVLLCPLRVPVDVIDQHT